MHGNGAAGAWDQHSQLKKNHAKLANQVDLPTAGLLQDLKQRGLLENTIVVFATEFGVPLDRRERMVGIITPSVSASGWQEVESREVWSTDQRMRSVFMQWNIPIMLPIFMLPFYISSAGWSSLEVPGHKRIERDYGHVISEILA